ncbi:UNVERIFIED_CONTAM: hypothetical protein Sradi_4127400 [Sesamum radiatum]|uniref:DUF4283 domain-containing protein n=1 Tax=Sesamum radiatum TaxID=300843 RepID=A0AAW2P3R4_SESRA
MEEVIEGAPWLFHGQPIVLQKWQYGMAFRKHFHTQVPIWIKLRHLLVEFWTEEGLSMVASGVGRPLYPDAITKTCTRLDFARVCVMLNYNSKLPKYIVVMQPTEDGALTPYERVGDVAVAAHDVHSDKGKSIMVHNSFQALDEFILDDDVEIFECYTSRGPASNPSPGVP